VQVKGSTINTCSLYRHTNMSPSTDEYDHGEEADAEAGIGIVQPDYEVLAKRLRDFDDHEIEEEAKRRRKSTPPPKKVE